MDLAYITATPMSAWKRSIAAVTPWLPQQRNGLVDRHGKLESYHGYFSCCQQGGSWHVDTAEEDEWMNHAFGQRRFTTMDDMQHGFKTQLDLLPSSYKKPAIQYHV
ncbi:hypothetical protein O0I10_012173 [Lichtheimia ornata]|uniref:Uncharacterized protein n=1 Tax=Lichtheimia ornata TaxID=688661 RepID=A0AAD7URQ0_9FUNG|nr:uncharacterized protein O0I10_012173 [Lichtheimia ornata]KAJ8652212.1 hypothetical protein O0I10_012173 [Lichtheimia ornata]